MVIRHTYRHANLKPFLFCTDFAELGVCQLRHTNHSADVAIVGNHENSYVKIRFSQFASAALGPVAAAIQWWQ